MPYRFDDTSAYPYASGSLFLGLDSANHEIGIRTERHAITIAGARSGKGAALIIPNARRWPENLLVIDPKGENIEQSWEAREAMGQPVAALDPFRYANIPDRLRARFNPLAGIEPDSFTFREDVLVIADGLVRRTNPKNAEWDDGARDILAGVMAFAIADAPPEKRTLTAARAVLLQPKEALYKDAQRMLAFGGLAKAAGITIMDAIDKDKGLPPQFLSGARTHSAWIDSPPIAAVLESSTFELAELKTGARSLFVILPPEYMETHAAFMRLFVRCALNAMAKGGTRGRRCLFLMDEFFQLGRIDQIAKAAGLMPGYGVHLWPFLQDLGQLRDLYGPNGSETFFANADAHIFFGNTDALTLDYISRRLGQITPGEAAPGPPSKLEFKDRFFSLKGTERLREEWARDDENRMRHHSHAMAATGNPRLTAGEIARLIGKGKGEAVARSMIVFAMSGDVMNLHLAPYFAPAPTRHSLPAFSNPWLKIAGFAVAAPVLFKWSHEAPGFLPALVLFVGAIYCAFMAVGGTIMRLAGRI